MEQGSEDQLTHVLLGLWHVSFKKKKSWTSSIKKIWVFHIKIQIWASLEKEMADPSSKGPPLPTQSKLGHPNHFITWTFYFLHSALPKLFTYVICSAYVSSLKNLKFPKRAETLYVLFKAILNTLFITAVLKSHSEMCWVDELMWPPWAHILDGH